MTATPETFKPGERWLCARERFTGQREIFEVQCIEWSESGLYCKIFTFYWDNEEGKRLSETRWSAAMTECELLERLPDEKQSGSDKAEPARGTEAPCGECACCKWARESERGQLCKVVEGFPTGTTFSVTASTEREVSARGFKARYAVAEAEKSDRDGTD